MEKKSFNEVLKQLMEVKRWGVKQLSIESGVGRTTIQAYLERTNTKRVDAEIIKKLAAAFGDEGHRLYEALGYPAPSKEPREEETMVEIAEKLLQKAKLSETVSVPVYERFYVHAGAEHRTPAEYFYLPRVSVAGENIEAYYVRGHCLSPKVEDGDIVVVDRDVMVEPGRLVICLLDDEICVGHFEKRGEECWLKNNDESVQIKDKECGFCRVIIGIYKRP